MRNSKNAEKSWKTVFARVSENVQYIKEAAVKYLEGEETIC